VRWSASRVAPPPFRTWGRRAWWLLSSGENIKRHLRPAPQLEMMTMTTFDTREKEFEARFKHDQELQFKITARRNLLLGLWGAHQLGLLGDAAQAYAQKIVEAQLQSGGNRNVVDKLAADLGAKNPTLTAARIRFELKHFAEQAKRQVMQK
jgi:hypothetical protein